MDQQSNPSTLRTCVSCKTTKTPLWRRNDKGQSVCNACGLYLKPKQKTSLLQDPTGTGAGATIRCVNCDTIETPLWRRDENGAFICNACGLYYKLHHTNRPIELKHSVIRRRRRSVTLRSGFFEQEAGKPKDLEYMLPPIGDAPMNGGERPILSDYGASKYEGHIERKPFQVRSLPNLDSNQKEGDSLEALAEAANQDGKLRMSSSNPTLHPMSLSFMTSQNTM